MARATRHLTSPPRLAIQAAWNYERPASENLTPYQRKTLACERRAEFAQQISREHAASATQPGTQLD